MFYLFARVLKSRGKVVGNFSSSLVGMGLIHRGGRGREKCSYAYMVEYDPLFI